MRAGWIAGQDKDMDQYSRKWSASVIDMSASLASSADSQDAGSMVFHPESAGRAHIIGMIDRFISRLVARSVAATEHEITFETMESVAMSWKER